MQDKHVTRRDFMRALGMAGVGSAMSAGHTLAQNGTASAAATGPAAPPEKVATRVFGKTGARVSMLSLGGIFDITTNQLVLHRALDFGVTYWDTAHVYKNGNSEKGIGMFFEKNPEVRRNIFLVTKAEGRRTAEHLTARLEESLQRLKTDYVDLYFLHGIKSGDELTDEVKGWAEKSKAARKIRFFGFSTHDNMDQCLQAAARLGWIDGIMLKYDYRLMDKDAMRAAVDACTKAGVGLTAMKTQRRGPINLEDETDLKLAGHFVKRGFTEYQARLKAVWQNPQIASICSQMPNITQLTANVAAALDKTKLTAADQTALREYAGDTCSRNCDGCTFLCEEALAYQLPVGDVMRSLMYHHAYGDGALAREVLVQLPQEVRGKLATLDFSPAERVCPNRLPIGRLMRQAQSLLT